MFYDESTFISCMRLWTHIASREFSFNIILRHFTNTEQVRSNGFAIQPLFSLRWVCDKNSSCLCLSDFIPCNSPKQNKIRNNPKTADISMDMDEFFGSEMKFQFTGWIFQTVFCQFQFKLFIRKLFRCPLNFTWPTFTRVFLTFLAQIYANLSIILLSHFLATRFSQIFSIIHLKNHFKENIIDKDIDSCLN